MKKILTCVVAAMIGMIVFSGCSPSGGGASPSYSMTATIGGTAFNPTNVYAVITGGSLAITANNGTSTAASYPSFSTVIYSYTSPMTYTVTTTSGSSTPTVSGTYGPDANLADAKVANAGTVTITSVSSTTVVGSFTFTCVDGTAMSGSFTAKRL